jgi:TRAP-type mannitol/chloroaromatic compound transport system permease small subunit
MPNLRILNIFLISGTGGMSLSFVKKIVRIFDLISIGSGKIFSWVLVILLSLSIYEVFTRRVLGSPTIWTHEILKFALAASIMFALGYTHYYEGHVNVDLFYMKFSPKARAVIDIVTFVPFIGLFCYVFLIEGWEFFMTSFLLRERTSSAFNVIVYPVKFFVPAGGFLLTIAALSTLLKNIYFVVKGEKL